jgi:type III secretory pathway component EscV
MSILYQLKVWRSLVFVKYLEFHFSKKYNNDMQNPQTSNVIQNEVDIIDFLVDNNAMIKDFSKSQLSWFFVGENFHIVLYLTEGEKPKFERYIVERFSENMNDMISLWNHFDRHIQESQETRIMKLAKNKVHDLIAMSETFRALFRRSDFDEE